MVDILVRPVELRQIAGQLRASSKKVGTALQAIDNDILALKGDRFLGNRANSVQSHYAPKREALLKAREIVAKFAGDLDTAASTFEQADKMASNQGSFDNIFFPFIPNLFGVFGQYDDSFADFSSKWEKMSKEERLGVISNIYDDLASKYGLEKVPINVEDLPDKKIWFFTWSDSKGQYRGDQIQIDIDNLLSNDGRDLLDTVVHEIRHQIQHLSAILFRENGDTATLPSGVSLEQARLWSENFKTENYIEPQDDYQGYRDQPIEQDARNFAGGYIEEYIKGNYGSNHVEKGDVA